MQGGCLLAGGFCLGFLGGGDVGFQFGPALFMEGLIYRPLLLGGGHLAFRGQHLLRVLAALVQVSSPAGNVEGEFPLHVEEQDRILDLDAVEELGADLLQGTRTGGPWIARGYKAWRSYEAMRTNRLMIPARKVFDIKLGVRLGNDVFIISKDSYQELPNGERRFFRPAVMNPSISDETLIDTYYVFYPHTAGLPTLEQEQDLVAHGPFYFKEYLFPAKDKLAARKTLARAGQNWWELLEHRAWLEAPRPKIVSKYFGGRRSFAFDKGGAYVVVVGSGWLLEKGALQTEITDDEVYLATLAYLSSTIAEGLLKDVSIQVSGGQADLTKKYVGQLPIPNLAKVKRTGTNKLVEMGAAIMDKRVENWADVDELVLSIIR